MRCVSEVESKPGDTTLAWETQQPRPSEIGKATQLYFGLIFTGQVTAEMILGFASRYACLGDLDKWAASRLQVACQ